MQEFKITKTDKKTKEKKEEQINGLFLPDAIEYLVDNEVRKQFYNALANYFEKKYL